MADFKEQAMACSASGQIRQYCGSTKTSPPISCPAGKKEWNAPDALEVGLVIEPARLCCATFEHNVGAPLQRFLIRGDRRSGCRHHASQGSEMSDGQ